MADLDAVRSVFEEFGRDDPMYAALTRREQRGNKWDAEAFFANGRSEIDTVMAQVEALGLEPGRGRALDFGCAVGRLTQALAEHFAEAEGVDIATSMVEGARRLNQHGARVRYHVNASPHLGLFEDASFDFVYTNKVLQHIPPAAQYGYVREFMRVLRPGGVAVFQFRNGPYVRPGTPRSLLYRLNRVHLRRLTQRLRGRHPYEMHYINRDRVTDIVAANGAAIADVEDLSRGKPNKSLRFFATKPRTPTAD